MQSVMWSKPEKRQNEQTGAWEVIGEGRSKAHAQLQPTDTETVCGRQIPQHASPAGELTCRTCISRTAGSRKTHRDKLRPLARSKTASLGRVAVIGNIEPERLTLATETTEIILTGDREIRAGLGRLAEHGTILYAGSGPDWQALRRLTPSVRWEQESGRKGKMIRFYGQGLPTVWFVGPALQEAEDRHAELFGFLRFLIDQGVNPGSPGGMAWGLWKRTLSDSFTPLMYDVTEATMRGAFKGGREQAPLPGVHHGAAYYDQTMAYPTVMADEPFPLIVRKAVRKGISAPVGIARATVRIPPMVWGPLPESGTRWPTNTTMTGVFTLLELRLAHGLGIPVEVHEVWEGDSYVDLFSDWHKLSVEGRQLPYGHGRTMAKSIADRLWGSFATSEENRAVLRSDGIRKRRSEGQYVKGRQGWDMLYLAVETTARVRERIYRETLTREDVGAVYVATDGVIATGPAFPQPFSANGEPGTYVRKSWAGRTTVAILGDGSYAYLNPQTGAFNAEHPKDQEDWTVSMEVSKARRQEVFWRAWEAKYGHRL